MSDPLLPRHIYSFLSSKALGQPEVLKKVSVAIYKHINGLNAGNLLLIGNSGTGKTTIMNAIQQFFYNYDFLKKHRVMTIMNANLLGGTEPGDVDVTRLIKNLEHAVNNTFGSFITDDKLKEYMEYATVCIDEVDKISASISGKVNVSGISIQQAMLTLLEGERILFETTRSDHGQTRKTKIPVDTSRMLFICGGAFEGLYDQICDRIQKGLDDRRMQTMTSTAPDGTVRTYERLVLRDQIRISDLFNYGMVPQFISRFHSIAVLEDLGANELKQILLTADDSPLRHSREYFKSMGVELQITKDALDLMANYAVENTRIGARALREVFTRIIATHEFDPFSSDKLSKTASSMVLTIDKDMVARGYHQ